MIQKNSFKKKNYISQPIHPFLFISHDNGFPLFKRKLEFHIPVWKNPWLAFLENHTKYKNEIG
jgi:hypothetical protein